MRKPRRVEYPHTKNGYDRLWVIAINHVLEDRESLARIEDLTDDEWARFIGPMIDHFEGLGREPTTP